MAEPLTIIAFIPALIQLGEYSFKFAKILRKYRRDEGLMDREIKNYENQILTFGMAIRTASSRLQRHHEKYPRSQAFRDFSNQDILNCLVKQEIGIDERLIMLERQVEESLQSRFTAVRYFRWYRSSAEILKLLPQMDSIRNTLHLLIEISHYESLELERQTINWWNRKRLEDLEKDLEFQKTVVSSQLEIIKMLQGQITYHISDMRTQRNGQKAILNLGQQVLKKNVRVPRSHPRQATPPSSRDSSPSCHDPSDPNLPNGPRRPNDSGDFKDPKGPGGPSGPRCPNRPKGPNGPTGPSEGLQISSVNIIRKPEVAIEMSLPTVTSFTNFPNRKVPIVSEESLNVDEQSEDGSSSPASNSSTSLNTELHGHYHCIRKVPASLGVDNALSIAARKTHAPDMPHATSLPVSTAFDSFQNDKPQLKDSGPQNLPGGGYNSAASKSSTSGDTILCGRKQFSLENHSTSLGAKNSSNAEASIAQSKSLVKPSRSRAVQQTFLHRRAEESKSIGAWRPRVDTRETEEVFVPLERRQTAHAMAVEYAYA
nr:uncharacterized protein CTRU02_07783 [Colletotrichum truncatum]KAF6790877.1 hypothetical protein CTRU02_07783 [Colletotrichum truncatum]